MTDDDGRDRRRREASHWMIALQERCDDAALHRRFGRWRRSAAANDAAWRELERVNALIRLAAPALRPQPPPQPAARRARRVGWAVSAMAAGAMAAGAAVLLIGGDMLPATGADATTRTGEVRRLRLADGSRVTLAPRSAIALGVASDGRARQVRLLRGTAFFEVRHDDAHPFRVVAGAASATDLGTAFEVRREASTMRLAVRDGLVRTACANGWRDPAVLHPGEAQAVDCAAGTHPRSRIAPAAVAGWIDGQLIVDDRPLGEVVAALRPWHRGVLLARGRGTARRVTGVYDLRDPARALAALRQAHGATTLTVTPWITVVRLD